MLPILTLFAKVFLLINGSAQFNSFFDANAIIFFSIKSQFKNPFNANINIVAGATIFLINNP